MDNKVLVHHGTKGMRWGVRKYQNKDGSLTPAGKARYDRDVRENNAKKKENRIVIDGPDPNRWAKEDISRTKKTVDSVSDMNKQLQSIDNNIKSNRKRERLNLSEMSDKEMRERINREIMERQYNDLFAPQKVSKGREAVTKTLQVAGGVLAVTSTSLSIALAIKELRG